MVSETANSASPSRCSIRSGKPCGSMTDQLLARFQIGGIIAWIGPKRKRREDLRRPDRKINRNISKKWLTKQRELAIITMLV